MILTLVGIIFICSYVFIGTMLGLGLVMGEFRDQGLVNELSGEETRMKFINIIGVIALVMLIWPYMLWQTLLK